MSLIFAFYGNLNITKELNEKLIAGSFEKPGKILRIPASNAVWGDPLYGVTKILILVYQLRDGSVYAASAIEGTFLEITPATVGCHPRCPSLGGILGRFPTVNLICFRWTSRGEIFDDSKAYRDKLAATRSTLSLDWIQSQGGCSWLVLRPGESYFAAVWAGRILIQAWFKTIYFNRKTQRNEAVLTQFVKVSPSAVKPPVATLPVTLQAIPANVLEPLTPTEEAKRSAELLAGIELDLSDPLLAGLLAAEEKVQLPKTLQPIILKSSAPVLPPISTEAVADLSAEPSAPRIVVPLKMQTGLLPIRVPAPVSAAVVEAAVRSAVRSTVEVLHAPDVDCSMSPVPEPAEEVKAVAVEKLKEPQFLPKFITLWDHIVKDSRFADEADICFVRTLFLEHWDHWSLNLEAKKGVFAFPKGSLYYSVFALSAFTLDEVTRLKKITSDEEEWPIDMSEDLSAAFKKINGLKLEDHTSHQMLSFWSAEAEAFSTWLTTSGGDDVSDFKNRLARASRQSNVEIFKNYFEKNYSDASTKISITQQGGQIKFSPVSLDNFIQFWESIVPVDSTFHPERTRIAVREQVKNQSKIPKSALSNHFIKIWNQIVTTVPSIDAHLCFVRTMFLQYPAQWRAESQDKDKGTHALIFEMPKGSLYSRVSGNNLSEFVGYCWEKCLELVSKTPISLVAHNTIRLSFVSQKNFNRIWSLIIPKESILEPEQAIRDKVRDELKARCFSGGEIAPAVKLPEEPKLSEAVIFKKPEGKNDSRKRREKGSDLARLLATEGAGSSVSAAPNPADPPPKPRRPPRAGAHSLWNWAQQTGLGQRGLKIHSITPNGNCQFTSVLEGIRRIDKKIKLDHLPERLLSVIRSQSVDLSSHNILREMVLAHIRYHKGRYSGFISAKEMMDIQTNYAFVDHQSVFVLEEILKGFGLDLAVIRVTWRHGELCLASPEDPKTLSLDFSKTVVLLYNDLNHYDLLDPESNFTELRKWVESIILSKPTALSDDEEEDEDITASGTVSVVSSGDSGSLNSAVSLPSDRDSVPDPAAGEKRRKVGIPDSKEALGASALLLGCQQGLSEGVSAVDPQNPAVGFGCGV